jgi:uroporphyrinogen decarboxylase
MSLTSREVVKRTIRFEAQGRFPYHLPPPYGSDFYGVMTDPPLDPRPVNGVDEWGCLWENIGESKMGQVLQPVIREWDDRTALKIPDIRNPKIWEPLATAREIAGDRFLIAYGVSLFERVHYIRGMENTWMDVAAAPEELGGLIDLMVDINLYAIERFAKAGADAFMWFDDWGLQHHLMVAPESWREIWKPRYAKVYKAVHDAGLFTFLHSCGDITSILDDLIEIGLDVIQMDQQENMGLERLGREFGGRITFWSPVDIQATMVNGSLDEIRAYCKKMVTTLGRPNGGFMANWYTDPAGAGHRQEALNAMCQEFVQLSSEFRKTEAEP